MAPRSSLSVKTLILVRHAHRSKAAGREVDNGLSKRGIRQAREVARFYRARFGDEKALLLSSSKLRCMETLEPLALRLSVDVEPSELLMEAQASERELTSRVSQFQNWWRDIAPKRVVACSHGDWLPVALRKLAKLDTELRKGGWAEFELHGDQARMTWLLQGLSF